MNRLAETTIKHGHHLHSAVARAKLWPGGIMKASIAACALALATSSFADRELGDLGGVGNVQFENSCSKEVQGDLMRGHALLHSMFYDEAIAVLSGVAAKDTNCAMAHWGVAMAYYHPLWGPPTPEDLKNGAAALAKAKNVEKASQREKDFIAALEVFYKDAETVPHAERAKAFEKAMGELAGKYPDDVEAQAFHALMLVAVAPPGDQTFANQKAAGEVLEKLWVTHPDHPGLPHYIIHAYDYPAIADKGLAAARRYGKIAPFVPHALHMPAHIFSRLSMWKDSIEVNRVSVEASKAYAAKKFPDATFGQELHNMDYIVYAHLQMGQSKKAKEYVDQVQVLSTEEGDARDVRRRRCRRRRLSAGALLSRAERLDRRSFARRARSPCLEEEPLCRLVFAFRPRHRHGEDRQGRRGEGRGRQDPHAARRRLQGPGGALWVRQLSE